MRLRAFGNSRLFTAYARPIDPAQLAARPAGADAATIEVQPGDLQVAIPHVPPGPITVCVLPFGIDLRDPRLRDVVPDLDLLEVHCGGHEVPAGATSHRIVAETPAMQRPR